MFSSVLILCIGNICRSPLAEAALREALQQQNKTIQVSSAGLHAMVEYPADPNSVTIAEANSLNLDQHKARQLNLELVKKADLILVMTQNQLKQVHQDYPSSRGKVFLLHNSPATDIPDPYKQDETAFEEAWKLIQAGVANWSQMLG